MSIIGVQIREEFGLSDTAFGILVATPILSGAASRLPLGVLADTFGGRIVFLWQMITVAIALLFLNQATAYWHFLVTGLFMGLAGGAFAIGVTYVSANFNSIHQGTALGIFGAGNAGAAITNLVAPLLAVNYGWRAVPQYYAMALFAMAAFFWLLTINTQTRRHSTPMPIREQLAPLKEMRVWRFGLYYYFVFGGFLALTLWLPQYYVGQYGLDLTTASFVTLLFTLPAALVRALGGWFADNFGARAINWIVFWVCLVCLFFLSYPPTTMTVHGVEQELSLHIEINLWLFTLLIFIIGLAMGFGKASIYRIIHDYYPNHMGAVGGMVGLLGALGGFSLPILFGIAADFTGIRSSCFMLLYGVIAVCMMLMYYAIRTDAFNQRLAQAQADEFLTL